MPRTTGSENDDSICRSTCFQTLWTTDLCWPAKEGEQPHCKCRYVSLPEKQRHVIQAWWRRGALMGCPGLKEAKGLLFRLMEQAQSAFRLLQSVEIFIRNNAACECRHYSWGKFCMICAWTELVCCFIDTLAFVVWVIIWVGEGQKWGVPLEPCNEIQVSRWNHLSGIILFLSEILAAADVLACFWVELYELVQLIVSLLLHCGPHVTLLVLAYITWTFSVSSCWDRRYCSHCLLSSAPIFYETESVCLFGGSPRGSPSCTWMPPSLSMHHRLTSTTV